MFYAMYDSTVSESRPGSGFANTKEALAFMTRLERDNFLKARYFDTSACAITRAEATKLSENVHGLGAYGVRIYDSESEDVISHYIILRALASSPYKVGDII